MIEKVNEFPMEELYYLESQDFLVDRETVYLKKKDKSMKLNSFYLGVSRLRVNNDKLLYLFNGLRGYYDVRSRYFKNPKIFEKIVPFSKKNLVNEYLINKYQYSDMLIYSLDYLNRPTITIKKEEGEMHYSFPSKLVEYLNKKREIKNSVEANKIFYTDIRQIKNIGYRFYLNPKRKRNRYNYKKIKLLRSVALGVTEDFFRHYNFYLENERRFLERVKRVLPIKRRHFFRKKKLMKKKKRFKKTPAFIKLLFLVSKRYLTKSFIKARKKDNRGSQRGGK